ncbi:LacI family DNA-binding transcriptional regulator [Diplocloster agilis]|uniref:LacI family DNA-binding transcriptional regulator n=1 Tax=Diplocloster agilis TaxID=2850323 RepID=A0A949K634_9FIRM|nr:MULTISPECIES: LacI family DNA-binding transcriptional regulator [Lachnospiraceae]MBU9736663.1 LacI family DNA-binding transcriptional regulator [Diplocloster agilis]MBU9743482.1 LacI family DNA-binding transcriptional regulator [Diplocloster agilis]MCU6734817.1 LacI family DNA-binding transcriptional regulator [Suonthocola fibrivorans]SCJ55398.1 Catabolite control protein [uncultured Clostridium sp.]
MKKVTLKQIAELADTSIGTVDRALNGRGRINELTKQRILQIADDLGYRPNKLASNLSRNKQLHLGILYPKYPTYFFDEMTAGVEQAAHALTDYNVDIRAFRCDYLNPASQLPLLDELKPEDYDGFVLNAGGSALIPSINRLADAGVTVATFNSDVRGSKRLFHVGVDPYLAGRISGELMGKIMGNQGSVCCLSGFHSVDAHTERMRGFIDKISEDYPGITVAGEFEYLDSDQMAEEISEKMFRENPGIGGVYTTSSPGAIGVGWYLDKHPDVPRPVVSGFDVTQQLCTLTKKDLCTFVIYQNPSAQAYHSLMLLADYLLQGVLPGKKHLMLQPRIVLKETIDDYIFDPTLSYQFLK